MKQESPYRLRITLVYAAVMLFGLAVAFRLFSIQLSEGDKWREQAKHVGLAMRTVKSERGHIYSEDGRLLATSVPIYEIRMDMRADGLTKALFEAKIDSLSWSLSRLFKDRSMQEYRRDLAAAYHRGERYYLVKRKCNHEELKVLRDMPLFRLGRYKSGFIVEKDMMRIKPFGTLASRTVGYISKSGTEVGLEGGFSPWLRGVTGERLERRLPGGVWMPVDGGRSRDPIQGDDLQTTLDMNLQDVADDALATQLRLHGAHHGCVVVMETRTGYIKAIANLTLQSDGTYAEDYNYAVGASTEPGSTFKTASVMVALEDGRLSMDQKFDTHGGRVRFYDRVMPDSRDGGYGVITLRRAIELSSNTAISQAIDSAYKNDPARFVEGLRELGFDESLGIRIPGEGRPVLSGPENQKKWSGVSLPWMSIGYEVSTTPMRLLTFYNAIANGGRMMQPQFVKAITRDGKVVEEFTPVTLKDQICSKRTLEEIKGALQGVVDTGTATNLRSAHFRIAGKTGTAQIAAENAGYKVNGVGYQASFVGYFPADAPRYTCIVVVNSPTKSGVYGNVVAGPVFREIADKIYSNRLEMQVLQAQVEPEYKTPASFGGNRADLIAAFEQLNVPLSLEADGEWVSTQAMDSLVRIQDRTIPEPGSGIMPNVRGMGLKDALHLLEDRGMRVQVSGSGMVKRQDPPPGAAVAKGTRVTLELVL